MALWALEGPLQRRGLGRGARGPGLWPTCRGDQRSELQAAGGTNVNSWKQSEQQLSSPTTEINDIGSPLVATLNAKGLGRMWLL